MIEHPKDPLYGKTLQAILEELLEKHGWEKLAQRININCFKKDPSIKSSLVFLRKTPWAREKVEELYVRTIRNPKIQETLDTPINLDL
jgi:uncharacterized protein (DUF2132 family)